MPYELVIVGGGNMGAALLGGLLDSGVVAASDVAVVEPSAARRADLERDFPGVAVAEEVPPGLAAVLAVKPPDVPGVATSVAAAGAARLVSIAAGVTTATIQAATGNDVAVLRAMPNTPALVRAGVSALAGAPSASGDDLDWAERILGAVGTVVRVDEAELDAVTGLTGSGPAYVFLLAEALIDAGVEVGLPRGDVEQMVTQLLVGSSRLLAERGDPTALRVMVTSPNGTTAAGLRVFDQRDLRGIVADAVRAATERSRELGG